MRIGGMILPLPFSNVKPGQIVRDGRTLRGMARKDHFVFPVDDSGNPYVNEEKRTRSFTWHGEKYRIEYFDGCFYPFVVKV